MEPLRHLQSNLSGGPSTTPFVANSRRRRQAIPHSIRVGIRIFALATSAAIVGVLTHSSAVWFSTRYVVQQQPDGGRQRAWPAHMELWPTWVMLGAAVIAILVQMLAFLTLCGGVRRLRESEGLHSWAVFISSAFGIAAWIAAAIYFKLQDSKGRTNWDLWSWSCTHKSLENGKMSFEAMCVEMKFTFAASIVVAALEIASLAIFGVILIKSRGYGVGYRKIVVEKR